MPKGITIKGKSIDAKFKSIENILRRMGRRLSHKVVGIIPPSIIFQYVDKSVDGIILKGILPAGVLTKACIAVKKYNTKKAVRFTFKGIDNEGNIKASSLDTRKSMLVDDINLKIESPSFFTINVKELDESAESIEPLIEDIWITILFQTQRVNSDTQTLMLEELEILEDLLEEE